MGYGVTRPERDDFTKCDILNDTASVSEDDFAKIISRSSSRSGEDLSASLMYADLLSSGSIDSTSTGILSSSTSKENTLGTVVVAFSNWNYWSNYKGGHKALTRRVEEGSVRIVC